MQALPSDLRGKDLVVSIPSFAAKVALVADGQSLVPIDKEMEPSYRSRGPHAWYVPRDLTQSPSLDLTLQVDSGWTAGGWLDSVPRLSGTPRGDTAFRRLRAFNELGSVAALGTLLLFGFTHLVLFLLDRRRTQYGWFSLQALTAAMYPCFVLGYSQYVFGTLDTCVFAVSQAIPPIAGVCFTRAAFKLGPLWRGYVWLLVAVMAIAVVGPGPFATARVLAPAVVVVGLVAILHHLFILASLTRRRPRPKNTVVLLSAWLFVTMSFIIAGPSWLGLGEPFGGIRAGSWGLVFVGLLQSVALSRDHIASLRAADALNAELGVRVALLETHQSEIQLLNDELRRQVAERSRHMSAAFSRIASGVSNDADLAAGDIIDDRYRVVRAVGKGGMGCVYEVVRITDDRRFALKVLSHALDGTAVARFAREAEIASSVNHPNVVAIVDVGIASSGVLFLVMEFVDGVPLAEKGARFGDVAWALALLREIALGLSAIHAAGIVHRDLKPGNVLVTVGGPDGRARPKISDFGISSLVASAETSHRTISAADLSMVDISAAPLTLTGVIMGTPVYMAPELAHGARSARAAADVFSLGVIAYEVLSGHRPFAEPLSIAALKGIVLTAPTPIASIVPGLATEVARWIDRSLAIDPDERGTATELANALARGA